MITLLGFNNNLDSGATLIEDGKIVASINEERLNRIKLYSGVPKKSIESVLGMGNKKNVDGIVISGQLNGMPDLFCYIKRLFSISPKYYYQLAGRFKHVWHYRKKHYSEMLDYAKRRFPKKKIFKVDHHLSHAASAHYTSGERKNLIVTMDAWGDRLSNGAYIAKENFKRIHSTSELDSLGYFYGRITSALGFRYHRHEGKVTGLAAYGKSDKRLMELMKKMIVFQKKSMSFKSKIGRYYLPKGDGSDLKKLFSQFKREDVAAAAQKYLEHIVEEYFRTLIEEYGKNNIALAGGVFANVKLNQIIKNIAGVRKVFIHPHMGDGGLGLGGVLQVYNQHFGKFNSALNDVYFGPKYAKKEILDELKKSKLNYKYLKHIEYEVAELISRGNVVARFDGRMEYGPRALGNRSILYHTMDKSVNDWLNKRLGRTEFMPFAPATLSTYAKKCYSDCEGGEYAAKFMTITFDCTDWMKNNCEGVVHVDGTARPQLVDKKMNSSYFKIIDEYRKISGIPSIVNTSFNMHEEPIVCTPRDAIRSFKLGHLDYLAIGNFLVKSKRKKRK